VYDDTLIAFIGDNGYFHGDRGLADKWYPYEQALRVPLIVTDPRLASGRRGSERAQVALNIDVAPTIISAAGIAVPDVMQGQDLSPLYLKADAPAWRDEFFYDHPTITSKDRIPSSQGVIRSDWKYVVWPEFAYEQLFDLKSDPQEVHNLAGDQASARQLATMRLKLDEWRKRAQ
jgi:arylsulfatase A-like enzyme